jgi:hypothetical protein
MITKNYVIKYNDPRHPDLRFRFAEAIELPIFVAFNDHGSAPPVRKAGQPNIGVAPINRFITTR